MKKTEPKHERLLAAKEESKLAELLRKGKKSKCKESEKGTTRSDHEKLWSNEETSKWSESNAMSAELNRAKLRDIGETPRCTKFNVNNEASHHKMPDVKEGLPI